MSAIDNGGLTKEQIQKGEVLDPHAVGSTRLREIVSYGRRVYDLGELLSGIEDKRRHPTTSSPLVASAVFFCGLLRERSFNALEPKLYQKPFVRLVGAPPEMEALCSADTLGRSLRVMIQESVPAVLVRMLATAERNKVFREGWRGAMRYVALDGWEPISSYKRHCSGCLVRKVKVKRRNGQMVEVEQYYHRYVVAMMIDDRLDLVLDFEPLLAHDLRPSPGSQPDQDEGELTAAYRLLRRVKETFNWIDVAIGDGLYANGVYLSLVKELRMGAVVIARKEGDEPLREALHIWQGQPPLQIVDDKDAGERIQLWDCRDLETLDSYDGPVRVVRGVVSKSDAPADPSKTWCMLVTGKAGKLAPLQVLQVGRGRWHIENTGFNQWTALWHFCHVFVHDAHAIRALYYLFFAAYNLLTLFLYRQLRSYGRDRGKDPTRTIIRLVDEMREDLARMAILPFCCDTS